MAEKEIKKSVLPYVLFAWAIAGAIIGILLMFRIKPWTPELGVTFSPIRQVYDMVWCLLVFPPLGFYCLYWWSKHPEWLAPRGRYSPGVKYSMVSPYTIVAAAVFAALGVAAGTTTFAGLDLAMLVWAMAMVLFGPFVGYVASGIAYILRMLLGLLPFPVGPVTVGHFFWETFTFAFGGAFYFWLIERTGKRNIQRWVTWVVALNLVHGFSFLSAFFWAMPADAYIPFFIWAWTGYRPGAVIATVIGLIIGEAIVKAIKTRYPTVG
jgi:hypothetical protein